MRPVFLVFLVVIVWGLTACATTTPTATYGQLVVAARVNLARALVSRCEALSPGYTKRFDAAYAKAESNFLFPEGVTDAVMAEAEADPELTSPPIVETFDQFKEDRQKQTCEQKLDYLVGAGDAVRKPDGAG